MHARISLPKATAKVLIVLLSCVARAQPARNPQPWGHYTHKTHSQVINSPLSPRAAFELDPRHQQIEAPEKMVSESTQVRSAAQYSGGAVIKVCSWIANHHSFGLCHRRHAREEI